jgi:seryl-tRNA synthetase
MLDIKFIRENTKQVKDSCKKRGVKCDIDGLLKLDQKKRKIQTELESISAQKNKASKEISASPSPSPSPSLIAGMKKVDKKGDKLKKELKEMENKLNELLYQVPNILGKDVPEGDEKNNKVIRKSGEIPKFDFKPKDHLELGERLDIIDVKRAAKISGARFNYLKGRAVMLEFALINLALSRLTDHGFIPVIPPIMMKSEKMMGMGYLEQTDAEESYYLPKDDLYLAGTSEQPLGAMYSEETLNNLPKRYVGFSSCFRREAGSYGKDTKGILRAHQFDKVEMFSFCNPDESEKEHKFILSLQEELMQSLRLPYQVVNIAAGDLGNPAAAKYDIETWMPGENKYRETHSTSNCTDFQARRLNIKFRDKDNKLKFVNTLNGTAFAIGRTLIAILENYQQKDGSIKIPQALQKYVNFKEIK